MKPERERYTHPVPYEDLKSRIEAGESFRSIGAKYGLSHERIRQIYNRYIKDLNIEGEAATPRDRIKLRAARNRVKHILNNETLFDIKRRCEYYGYEFCLVSRANDKQDYRIEVVEINRHMCRIYIIAHSRKHATGAKTEYGKVNILAANLEKADFIIVRNMVTDEYYIYPVSVFKPFMLGRPRVGFYLPMTAKRIKKSRKIEHEKYREAWELLGKKRKARRKKGE